MQAATRVGMVVRFRIASPDPGIVERRRHRKAPSWADDEVRQRCTPAGCGEEMPNMETLALVSQIIIALGLLNVWLIRARKPTAYRGGDARNMKEEFQAYGLPTWVMVVVGLLKVSLAILLLVGIWHPEVTKPAAIGIAILMLGAVSMHLKVRDPVKKALPAATLLVLSLIVILA